MNRFIPLALLVLALAATPLLAQTTQTAIPLSVIRDVPTITITNAANNTTPTNTDGQHEALIQFKFGTVVGSYNTCTIQAYSAANGIDYLPLGSTKPITVTTGTLNQWTLTEPPSTTPSTSAAAGFGQKTYYRFACSSYGTSAPVTVNVTYFPTDAAINAGSSAAIGNTTDIACAFTDATACSLVGLAKQNNVLIGTADPCQDSTLTKTNFNVRVASNSLTSLIAAQSAKTTYICWLKIETDGTGETVNVVEAAHTSTACDGSQTALEGSTTASQGIAIAANAGFVNGMGGIAMYKTSAVNHEVCALNNGSNSTHYSGQWVAR